jgi:hypothetical protein
MISVCPDLAQALYRAILAAQTALGVSVEIRPDAG